jgi:hypothetical protein
MTTLVCMVLGLGVEWRGCANREAREGEEACFCWKEADAARAKLDAARSVEGPRRVKMEENSLAAACEMPVYR